MTALLIALMMQTTAPPNQLQKCLTKARGNNMEMNACYGKELERTDKKMAQAADNLSKKMDRDGRKLLKKSQAAFLSHRRLFCQLKFHHRRQSKEMSMHTKWCQITMTRNRTGDLSRLLKVK